MTTSTQLPHEGNDFHIIVTSAQVAEFGGIRCFMGLCHIVEGLGSRESVRIGRQSREKSLEPVSFGSKGWNLVTRMVVQLLRGDEWCAGYKRRAGLCIYREHFASWLI